MQEEFNRMFDAFYNEYIRMVDWHAGLVMQKDSISPSDVDDIIFELEVMEEVIKEFGDIDLQQDDVEEEINTTTQLITECLNNLEAIVVNK